jgi:hypothetical protein
MADYEMPNQPCPRCGYPLDMAGSFPDDGSGERPPEPGDSTVCIGCAALLTFDAEMHLCEFTAEQLEALPIDDLMMLMQVRAMVVHAQRARDHQPPQRGTERSEP